ncbi:thioredoxin [bacterium]|nr:thioredoxin [bacterium]
MATISISMQNFEETVQNNDIVLIDFWAPWCGPCKMFGPIFEKISEKNTDIVFAKNNTEEAPELGGNFGVQAIPTLAIFRENIMVFKQAGMLPENALEDLIKQVRALNMDDVRAQIAEQEKNHDHEHQPAE